MCTHFGRLVNYWPNGGNVFLKFNLDFTEVANFSWENKISQNISQVKIHLEIFIAWRSTLFVHMYIVHVDMLVIHMDIVHIRIRIYL